MKKIQMVDLKSQYAFIRNEVQASIEEVLTTNTQNTGSLNLSGSFNLIGTENITGSTKITGNLSVTGNTSLTSLVISGSDPVANVQVFVPSSSVYNNASFNTPDRVASGIRFNWNNEDWTIGKRVQQSLLHWGYATNEEDYALWKMMSRRQGGVISS